MIKTIQLVVMVMLCLNFCFSYATKGCPQPPATRTYVYSFKGYNSGYKTGHHFNKNELLRGRIITVRNYTVAQLFALALRLENQKRIIIDVHEPEKLKMKYCYKLVVPYQHQDNFYVLMQRSLGKEFPEYVVKMEKRNRRYFMVVRDKEE
ncbi:hypothetical protein [Pedobacter frigoris]|uniref:hypothetical protein n=1 Tax=Pedobacter frigoris TaxID=2571272 RepID=UPI00292F8922|nr:hypothetical protein [Pedobacter frigoris]